MNHSQNITELIKKVANAAPSTENEYPALKLLRYPHEVTFNIGHSARHLTMSAGKLNKVIHDAEHGDKLEIGDVKKIIFSTMFTLCKLCELTGLSGEQLIDGVEGLVAKYETESSK